MSGPTASAGAASPAGTITAEDRSRARRAVIASSIGNALEWFDIIVYSSFAVVISALFFEPAGQAGGQATGILLTFGTFAVSYLIRPIGAMALGSFADRHGRKGALTLTIMLMMLGTLIMACALTAAMIGAGAALVILLSRLIQGFSAGGEFGTATAFLIENAPDKKTFYGSWQVATQGVSMFLASAFGFTLFTFLDHDALYSWGWRIPFFFALLIGPWACTSGCGWRRPPSSPSSAGFAPLILAWLVSTTGSLLAPSYFYIVIALISLVGLVIARQRFGKR